jgi:predicted dehydrogenase
MMQPLRVSVIGAGWWAVANHIPLLAADGGVALEGVARLGRRELDEVQSRFGFARASEDWRDLLDPAPDAVVIATPHALHAAQAVAFLEAGAHVLVEKPAAVTVAEGLALCDAALRAGRHVVVPHGWNWRPWSTTPRDWVADGRIGQLRHVIMHMASPAEDLFSGGGWQGAGETLFAPDPATWSGGGASGGYAWGQLPHLLGLLFLTVPDLEPLSVSGRLTAGPTGTDVYGAAHLHLSGGVHASLGAAATVPPGLPFQVDLRLFGTEGMIVIDLERDRVELSRNDGAREAASLAPGDGAYACEEPVRAFLRLARGSGEENRADARTALRCARVLHGLHVSHATHREVDVSGNAPRPLTVAA